MATLQDLLVRNRLEPITELSFSDIDDSFTDIPDEISEFTELKILNLTEFSVGRNLKNLLGLSQLEELSISDYRLTEFPIELVELPNLRRLFLDGKKLTSLPKELDDWQTLRYLNVANCENLSRIHGMPPNITYLNISHTAVREIQSKIYELKSLRKLVAGGLGFQEIPSEIYRISSLLSLFLPDNKISKISGEIEKLVELEELYLHTNNFYEFPESILNVTTLCDINFNSNHLSEIPDGIAQLKELKELDLDTNNFTVFPKVLIKLPKLQRLLFTNFFRSRDSSFNQITYLPPEIINCVKLSELDLRENPVENVPEEILRSGYEAIKNFFLSKLEADQEEFLFEAKMVVVGRGNVGKSVLTKILTDPNYKLSKSETTSGINVLQNPFLSKLIIGGTEVDFKLNIWDFGGQEKYDATHQLFITKRSVYLFLTEAREESNYLDFYYWLNTIRLFSDNSPVVIVLSKIDERKKSLPSSLYKEEFDTIVDFVDVSCADGYENTIEHLKQVINKAISVLPQVKMKLSNRWIDIRKSLEELSKKRDFISYKEYLELCSNNKLDKSRADFLSQYLNDLGAIIHHRHDLLLKETVFINTDWCVDGMYNVLDSAAIIDNNGKFTTEDLKNIWNEARFEGKQAELLKLMHEYHLCFELKDGSGFIAPDLLPPDKPANLPWDYSNNLQFEYRYEFMPAGILSRFIVKSHAYVKDSLYWKHGIVLSNEDTLALVEEDYINGKIKISLRGKNKKGLLSAIRMYIKEINKDFDKSSKLIYEEMVPCNCQECLKNEKPHFFKFNVLRMFEDKGKRQVSCDKSAEDVSIKSLIDDIQVDAVKGSLQTNKDLRDFVMSILTNIIEKEIVMKSSNNNFWRDQHFSQPKNETEFQPYITNTLDHYCKINGISVTREVKEANGNVDIELSTRNDDGQVLRVCIEIKKAHHQDVETAIKTQLPLYMRSAGTDAGIYLVVWLKNEHHPYPKKFYNIPELTNAIQKHNPSQKNIAVKVLDACKVETPSKIKLMK